ncbi:MAG: hypothetical protein PHG05_01125 [Candidatus Nanoarchaeia archaeon]|nr:hypothetical protein [Candidatus Nanoarchaeia archaeon]
MSGLEVTQQQDISYTLSDLTARIRILESKYNTYGERMLLMNQNMITEYQKLSKEIKNMNEEIIDLKRNLQELKETTEKIIREMNIFAKKDSVKVLEKYINLWNPMKFITEEDVRKILRGELKLITSPHSNEL